MWQEYGLVGLIVGALFALILYIMRDHRTERKEWINSICQSNDKVASSMDRLVDEIRYSRLP